MISAMVGLFVELEHLDRGHRSAAARPPVTASPETRRQDPPLCRRSLSAHARDPSEAGYDEAAIERAWRRARVVGRRADRSIEASSCDAIIAQCILRYSRTS